MLYMRNSKEAFPLKYWRGYLVAAIFAAFTWGLMAFAESHAALIDMVYPYVTRMFQDTLAQWSGSVELCVWQVAVIVMGVVALATLVPMIILRWNPIQWFGWVLAVPSILFFLHTGIYGLNSYAGPLAEDVRLDVTEYTVQELQDATVYYRDLANSLAGQVQRDGAGNLAFSDFDTLAAQAGDGFHALVYDQSLAVFAGNTQPVKKLGWADMYTSMGITGVTMPLTGEAAVNPQTPASGLPFTICHEMAHRMSIAYERDANFAAYLACRANPSVEFQYSGYFMAYRYCFNALSSAAGSSVTQQVAAGVDPRLQQDLNQYRDFFAARQDQKATELANSANDTYIKVSGDEQGIASYGDVCDLLVSNYIKEIILPTQVEEAPVFDPEDKTQVDISDIIGTPSPTETTEATEAGGEG